MGFKLLWLISVLVSTRVIKASVIFVRVAVPILECFPFAFWPLGCIIAFMQSDAQSNIYP